MRKFTEEEKYQLILKCRESSLSERKWCEKNEINVSTFRYWSDSFKKKGVVVPPATRKKSEKSDTCTVKVEVTNRTAESYLANNETTAFEIDFGFATVKVSNIINMDILEKVIHLLDGKINNRKK